MLKSLISRLLIYIYLYIAKLTSRSIHFQVGGSPITLPSTDLHGNDLNITQDGDFLTIDTECGLKLVFDGKGVESVATVWVPLSFKGNLGGLCGDCDGSLNDMKTADGAKLNKLSNEEKFSKMSDSFKVDETADEGLGKQ